MQIRDQTAHIVSDPDIPCLQNALNVFLISPTKTRTYNKVNTKHLESLKLKVLYDLKFRNSDCDAVCFACQSPIEQIFNSTYQPTVIKIVPTQLFIYMTFQEKMTFVFNIMDVVFFFHK